jgi:predicted Zn finger-like uncharacterized protein
MRFSFQPALKIVSLRGDPSAQRAQVQARRSGLIAWLLHLMGLGNLHTLAVSPSGFRREEAGFSGHSKVYVPLAHTTASVFVLRKPVEWLAAGVPLFLSSFGFLFAGKFFLYIGLGLLVLGILFILLFFLLPRRVTLGIVTDAATAETLKLKANAMEREKLQRVARIIESLLGGAAPAEKPPTEKDFAPVEEVKVEIHEPAPPPVHTGGALIIECPHCRSRLQVTEVHRGQQVRCPSCREVILVR